MFSAFEKLKSTLISLPSLPFGAIDLSVFQPEDELPYLESLPEEKQIILDKLLDNLSIEYFPKFIINAPNCIYWGKKANSIHPFNTFEFFLSTNERIEKTKTLYYKTGISIGFENFKTQSIKGFCYFLEERHKKNELFPYLEKFCEKTKKDKTLLESLIEEKNFQKFVEEILINF